MMIIYCDKVMIEGILNTISESSSFVLLMLFCVCLFLEGRVLYIQGYRVLGELTMYLIYHSHTQRRHIPFSHVWWSSFPSFCWWSRTVSAQTGQPFVQIFFFCSLLPVNIFWLPWIKKNTVKRHKLLKKSFKKVHVCEVE